MSATERQSAVSEPPGYEPPITHGTVFDGEKQIWPPIERRPVGRPRSTARTCSIVGCEGAFYARGLCLAHYNAWYAGRLDVEAPAELPPHRKRSLKVTRTPAPALRSEEEAFARAWESLNAEQQQTLRAHALGSERREVAEKLYVSGSAIKGRLNTIFHRLGWRGSYGGGRRAAYFLGRYDGRRDT